MSPADNVHKSIKNLKLKASAELDERVHSEISKALEKSKNARPNVWRIIMKSKISRLAAAAVIIIVGVLSITFMDKSVAPAYALEQSIEAYHSVRTIQVRTYTGRDSIENDEFSDCWIKYDDAGMLSNFRMEVEKSADGPTIIVWNQGVAECWMPTKNKLMIARGDQMAADLEKFVAENDPKQTLDRLYDARDNYGVELTIKEPTQDGDPIVLEIINTIDKARFEYLIDADTKLVTQISKYHLGEQEDELDRRFEFHAYNQPIDPSVFEFNEIPDDALIIDRSSILVGLSQGDLTDNEIAALVVRECFEASIAQDYGKVKRLLGGLPGDTIEMMFGGRILRIVSIGQPEPHEKHKHILCVPIEVENERGNLINFKPYAQCLEDPPDRWIVSWGEGSWGRP
jgi:ribosomal protein L18E